MNISINSEASSADFEFAALREARNYRCALVSEFGKRLRGRVIEIGAGIGQMTQEFRKLPGIEILQSVEPDKVFCDQFRKSMPGQPLVEGTIGDVEGDQWDAIVSINVLEHIKEDEIELSTYAKLLRNRKGALNLFVPARPEIYSPIDKDFGHFRRYTRRGLILKLEKAGFVVEKIRYYNFVGYFAWWWKFCVIKRRNFNKGEIIFFDRVLFPITFFIESKLCRPPIGQSLLVVARSK